MAKEVVVVRFNSVSFDYGRDKEILKEASFAIRPGTKTTIMGQNGAGKSTILKLITNELKPKSGTIHVSNNLKVAYAKQIISQEELELTITEFFEKCFEEKIYAIAPKIDTALEIVNLEAAHDKKIKDFSGGQQARLLLASALIQEPELLILDEPTNNLDAEGIGHLMSFLMCYEKTCIVISHDADFLNTFTDSVLYLDIFTQKIDQYVGDYYNVIEEIATRVEKERRKNAQFEKKIKDNKEKINYFANKGGKMRLVARKMKEEVARMETNKVAVKREDQEIRDFSIPTMEDLLGEILSVESFTIMQNKKEVTRKADISLKKNEHLLLKGPNGIGKTTLLEKIATQQNNSAKIKEGVKVGYYRQDFSTLDFEETVHDSLESIMDIKNEQKLRRISSGFLIDQTIINAKIGSLSEGQKGLVAFARLTLQEPGLLILDEPTNHINFRHIPIIAKALNEFKGTMVLVSHVPEFVEQIRIDKELDLAN